MTNTSTVFSGSGEVIPDDLILTDLSQVTLTFDSTFDGDLDDLHVGQGVKAKYEILCKCDHCGVLLFEIRELV